MVSDAQKRAANNWRSKNKLKVFNLTFYSGDEDIVAWLDSQDKKAKYLRNLIREDMKKKSKIAPYCFGTDYKHPKTSGC